MTGDAMDAEIVDRGVAVKLSEGAFHGEKQLFLRDPGGYSSCFRSPAKRA